MPSVAAMAVCSTSETVLRQTHEMWWSIWPFTWPVMYSDPGNLSNLTPVVLWSGKINLGFWTPNAPLTDDACGAVEVCWYRRGHALMVYRGEVMGLIDTSLQKVDTHSESEQTKRHQSTCSCQGWTEEVLLTAEPRLLLGPKSLTHSHYLFSLTAFSLSLYHLDIAEWK